MLTCNVFILPNIHISVLILNLKVLNIDDLILLYVLLNYKFFIILFIPTFCDVIYCLHKFYLKFSTHPLLQTLIQG